jgi:hypothetical protein
MPGLMRGMARVAVVSGTATAVSNRVSRRQAGRWADQNEPQQQEQQYAPPPQAAPPPPQDDMESKLAQLKDLGALKEQGVLTDAEFEVQKDRILHG